MQIVVRKIHGDEEAVRQKITQVATEELRTTYVPRTGAGVCSAKKGIPLVAVKGDVVVGTAEYLVKDDHVYVQGIAVHRIYRRLGVCRMLIAAIEKMAKKAGLNVLALCAIEETGNAAIFENLGFEITRRMVAPGHVSPTGGAVTRVDMGRKFS